MGPRLYSIGSYIGPNDWFHFARKTLDETRPEFLHFHDYHELFLVEKGSAWHSVNGIEQSLGSGALVFVRPGDVHAIAAARGERCQIINVMFRNEIAAHLEDRYSGEFGGRYFWSPSVLPATYVLSGPRMERAINTAQELQTAHRTLVRIEEFLLTLMVRVVDIPDHPGGRLPDWLVAACNEARDPDVFRGGAAALVAVAGRGHEHVCRAMKRHLGLTPTAYINRIRMEQAALMLATSNLPVPDVAFSCGIENLSHFYRIFRRHYGSTPRAYRLEHRKSAV